MAPKYSPNYVLHLMGNKDKVLNHYNNRLNTQVLSAGHKAWCLAQRGEAYLQMGKRDEAERDLQEAIGLNPNSAWAYAKLGEVYRTKGNDTKASIDRWNDYNRAIECFDKALDLDPDNAWAQAHRGATHANARLRKYLVSVPYGEIKHEPNFKNWDSIKWDSKGWDLVKQVISKNYPTNENVKPLVNGTLQTDKELISLDPHTWSLQIVYNNSSKKYILTQSLTRRALDVFEYMYDAAKSNLERAIALLGGEYGWAIGYLGTTEFIKAADDFKDQQDNNDRDAAILLFKAHHHLMNAVLKDNSLLNQAIEPGLRHQCIFLEFAKLLFDMNHRSEALEYCNKALMEVLGKQVLPLDVARVYYLRSRIYSDLGEETKMQEDAREVKLLLEASVGTPRGQKNPYTNEESEEINKLKEYANAVLSSAAAADVQVVSESSLLFIKSLEKRKKDPKSAEIFQIASQLDCIAWE